MSKKVARILVGVIILIPLIVGMFIEPADSAPFPNLPITVGFLLMMTIILGGLAAIVGFIGLCIYAFCDDADDNQYRGL